MYAQEHHDGDLPGDVVRGILGLEDFRPHDVADTERREGECVDRVLRGDT